MFELDVRNYIYFNLIGIIGRSIGQCAYQQINSTSDLLTQKKAIAAVIAVCYSQQSRQCILPIVTKYKRYNYLYALVFFLWIGVSRFMATKRVLTSKGMGLLSIFWFQQAPFPFSANAEPYVHDVDPWNPTSRVVVFQNG